MAIRDLPGRFGIRLRHATTFIGRGATLWTTDPDGLPRGGEHGLWVDETRMLSRYEWTMDGARLTPAGAAVVEANRWVGYFICAPIRDAESDGKKRFERPGSEARDPAQATIELRCDRVVDGDFRERIEVTNHTRRTVVVRLRLGFDADFADIREALGERQRRGRITRECLGEGEGRAAILLAYEAEHAYAHDGERGVARVQRSLRLNVGCQGVRPVCCDTAVTLEVTLAPHASFGAWLTWMPAIEPRTAPLGGAGGVTTAAAHRVAVREPGAPERLEIVGPRDSLAVTVVEALWQARRDLDALRIDAGPDRESILVAGWPTYTAFFGRDALVASSQAAMAGSDPMRASLAALAASQGRSIAPWRDEQPGRMLHEHHTGPLATLQFGPHGRYYGDSTASLYYPSVVAALWRWTGDLELVRPFVGPALDALAWADAWADEDGDGLYRYRTRSGQGEKNQGWKDSSDAIVYPDGTQVEAPIGTCIMQACVYASKLGLSRLLSALGEGARARRLLSEAGALRRRFNDVFWMDDEKYLGLAVDSERRLVRTITSDAGVCLASGILDGDRAAMVAKRLMAPDLFSGWGLRTLSTLHPAYDPFAYHRGTVWPAVNAFVGLGFARYRLVEALHALSRAHFEAVRLFDGGRLPETFAGHPRDADHPFPGLYPRANSPQAWSSSSLFAMLEALLGIAPDAPNGLLSVDPHLPDWLPSIELRNLRVGGALVDLRFERRDDDGTAFEVLGLRGALEIVRRPAPASAGVPPPAL